MDFNKHELAFILSCIGDNCIRYETRDGRYHLTGKEINNLIKRFRKELVREEGVDSTVAKGV